MQIDFFPKKVVALLAASVLSDKENCNLML